MIDKGDRKILQELRCADGLEFARLVQIAKLDPAKDFRGADLRNMDFEFSDLSGFDFSGADLRGARLNRAKTEGAVFTEALTEGAVWPPSGGDRLQRELQSWQQEVLIRVITELSIERKGGLVSIPAGLGKSLIIEKLLDELGGTRGFRKVLIVVSTRAEREQYNLQLGRRAAVGVAVEVLTAQRLKLMISSEGSRLGKRSLDTNLVLVIGEPGSLLSVARALPRDLDDVPMLGFTSLLSTPIRSNTARVAADLQARFGRLLYTISPEEAVSKGFLVEVPVEIRQPEISAPSEQQGLLLASRDLAYQISERFQSQQCVVICSDTRATALVANTLADCLVDGPEKVMTVHGRDVGRKLWDTIQAKTSIVVMTASAALASPPQILWNASLIALLAYADERLLERLRFRPVGSNSVIGVIVDFNTSAY